MAQDPNSAYAFDCPKCKKTIATLSNDCSTISLKGNATIVSDFPPKDYSSKWLKCSDCKEYTVLKGTVKKRIRAYAGGKELKPGDWLCCKMAGVCDFNCINIIIKCCIEYILYKINNRVHINIMQFMLVMVNLLVDQKIHMVLKKKMIGKEKK